MNPPNSSPATCPGAVIREKLKTMRHGEGWTQEDLAEVIRKPLSSVNLIINGKCGITADTAHRLAAAFGTTARYWMELEVEWKLAKYRTPSAC